MFTRVMTWAVVAFLGLSALSALVGSASADDEYPADNPTECQMSTASVRAGQSVVTRVNVRSNGTERPRGKVSLTYRIPADGSSGRTTTSKSVAYDGKALRVTGPKIDRPGSYRVSARFTPRQGSNFRRCSGQDDVQVLDEDIDDNADGDNDANDNSTGTTTTAANGGPGGTLPDTGGPDLLWLLLGLGLVLGGAGLVVAGRHEPDSLLA